MTIFHSFLCIEVLFLVHDFTVFSLKVLEGM